MVRFILLHWYSGLAMLAILHRQGGYDSDTGHIGVEVRDLVYEAYKYGEAMANQEGRHE